MKNVLYHNLKNAGRFFLLAALLFGCNQDPVLWKPKSVELVMSNYIATTPGFGEFNTLLLSTGLDALLSVRGPFTLFLPNDEAMQEYYSSIGKSFDELTMEERKNLVLNHLVTSPVYSGDIKLGAIIDTNAIGDYISSEFDGAEIILNKNSRIIDRDVDVHNGVIHVINKVLAPANLDVFNLLASMPQYSLFTEGLRKTLLKDTLSKITIPWGNKRARVRFTVLAVSDSVFNANGITTIEQLIARYTGAPDSITYLNNGFYRYMEYHCLGGTYFLSSLESKLYSILSADNNIAIQIDTDYKLNFDKLTGLYTGFNIPQSNYSAKNGAIHTVNDLLPVVEPAPQEIRFETTDYFDIKMGDYYKKYYMKWFDGQNTFAKIKWEGDYLQYYYKNHDSPSTSDKNNDNLNMLGYWWIEITTPKIMKGNYSVSTDIWASQLDYAVFVDGEKIAIVKSTDPQGKKLGEVNWTTTAEHKIKVQSISYGTLFWDEVIFTPVK